MKCSLGRRTGDTPSQPDQLLVYQCLREDALLNFLRCYYFQEYQYASHCVPLWSDELCMFSLHLGLFEVVTCELGVFLGEVGALLSRFVV